MQNNQQTHLLTQLQTNDPQYKQMDSQMNVDKQANLGQWLTAVLAILMLSLGVTGQAHADTQTRQSAFEYDAETGLLTKEVIEPNKPDLCVVKVYTYDDFGNRDSVTTRNCNNDNLVNTSVEGKSPNDDDPNNYSTFNTRKTTIQYDDKGRFPEKTVNAVGHVETKVFNGDYGTVKSVTLARNASDTNTLTSSWLYDDYGRVTRETRPDGTYTTTSYTQCTDSGCTDASNNPMSVNSVLTRYKVTTWQFGSEWNTPAAPYTVAYQDNMGRSILGETLDVLGNQIYTETQYDHLGQKYKTSIPYKSSMQAKDKRYEELVYDAIGRVEEVIRADGTKDKTTYAGYKTTYTNAKGQQKIEYKNSQGQIEKIIDALSNSIEYKYDSLGHLVQTTDALGNKIKTLYDIAGRKIAMDDPDKGVWKYEYNALGELIKQIDARGHGIFYYYDKLGRKTRRSDPYTFITDWSYDQCDTTFNPAGRCTGKLVKEETNNGLSRVFMFDSYGRPTGELNDFDNESVHDYGIVKNYDSAGRVSTTAYPTIRTTALASQAALEADYRGWYITNVYNSTSGLLEKVVDAWASPQQVLWKALETDNAGRLTKVEYDNKVKDVTEYEYETGLVTSVTSGTTSTPGQWVSQSYEYDDVGNLTKTTDGITALVDDYTYDVLNRLTKSAATLGTKSTTMTMTYTSIGNIDQKIYKTNGYTYDANYTMAYSYLATRSSDTSIKLPHAVSKVVRTDAVDTSRNYTHTFDYDGNGNQISTTDEDNNVIRAIKWHSWNMPEYIHGSGVNTLQGTSVSKFSFKYNGSRERVLQTLADGTKVYNISPRIDAGIHVERRELPDGTVKMAYSLYAASYPFGQRLDTYNTSGSRTKSETTYYHKDRLGSVVAVTDANGNLVERRSYDAWGKRRNTDGTERSATFVTGDVRHAFTGHEDLGEIGIIHMNGRLYDPVLGRFLSADPHIQFVHDMQNYNRYSYINNNPLSATDPSGYFIGKLFKKLFNVVPILRNKTLRTVAAIVIAVQAPYLTQTLYGAIGITSTAGPVAIGAVGGFSSSFIASGGDFRSAIRGAITGAAFAGVGHKMGLADGSIGKIAGHAVVGCASSVAGGGKCSSGALSAGITQAFAPVIDGIDDAATLGMSAKRAFAAAIVGGTTSVISGGKFANGAMTGAFSRLYNDDQSVVNGKLLTVTEGFPHSAIWLSDDGNGSGPILYDPAGNTYNPALEPNYEYDPYLEYSAEQMRDMDVFTGEYASYKNYIAKHHGNVDVTDFPLTSSEATAVSNRFYRAIPPNCANACARALSEVKRYSSVETKFFKTPGSLKKDLVNALNRK